MREDLIEVIADFLETDKSFIEEDTCLRHEYNLSEEDYINLSDEIDEKIGVYIDPNAIEEADTVSRLFEFLH